jgi:hypothetical protein
MDVDQDENRAALLRDVLGELRRANEASLDILERFARGRVSDPAMDISQVLKAHVRSMRAAEKALTILADHAFAQRLSKLS